MKRPVQRCGLACLALAACTSLACTSLLSCSSGNDAAPAADASTSDSGDAGTRPTGTPGEKAIDFPSSVKIHNGMPLALSLEPVLASKTLTEGDIALRPPVVVGGVVDGSACKANGEKQAGLEGLRSLGLVRVDEIVIDMEPELIDPNTMKASFARVCIGVRDAAGKWHWDLRPMNVGGGSTPQDPRSRIIGKLLVPIQTPIDAVQIIIGDNEVSRTVYRVRYEVLAP